MRLLRLRPEEEGSGKGEEEVIGFSSHPILIFIGSFLLIMAFDIPVRIPSIGDVGRFPSAIFLVLTNLVPLFGALFLGWNASSVIVLYWSENVIIGGFNVLKMVVCAASDLKRGVGDRVLQTGRTIHSAFLIVFFTIHFGLFTLGHGICVAILFGADAGDWWGVMPGFVSLFISHAASYVMNFIGNKEYLTASVGQLFVAPYQRIFVMHIVIIFSAFLMLSLGMGLAGLVLLVFLKTNVDLGAHLSERERMAGEGGGWKLKVIG